MAIYGAVVGIVFAVAALTGYLPSPGEARDWGEDLGDFAYFAFVPLFVLANFIVTWPILAGAAGLLLAPRSARRSPWRGSRPPPSPRCWWRESSPQATTATYSRNARGRLRTSSLVTVPWR